MKKIILAMLIFILAFSLCACQNKNGDNKEEAKENTENAQVTYSGDDLSLYYMSADNNLTNAINLYMRESDINYDDDNVADIMNSCNVGFGESNGERYINYIYLYGSGIPVFTAKGIHTTGLNYLDEEKCSSEEETLAAYGINTEEEEVYFKPSDSSDSKMLAIHFKVDKDGNVNRVKYSKGKDISDFSQLEDSNAYLYLEINNSKVVGVSLGCK